MGIIKNIYVVIKNLFILFLEEQLNEFFQSQAYVISMGDELEELSIAQTQRKNVYDSILKDIEEIFQVICKGCVDIIMYGSRVTGIATNDLSDLDVFVDTSNVKIRFNLF